MALAGNHVDTLNFYLTGAASDGGAQTDPAASLGGFRSSTAAVSRGYQVQPGSIPNVRILSLTGYTPTGLAYLTADGPDSLVFSANGDSPGDSVTITNGQTRLVVSNDGKSAVKVARTSSNPMYGVTAFKATITFNHLFGFENIGSADRTSGEDFYRCAYLLNVSDWDVTDTATMCLGTLGTQKTTDSAQLGISGSGTITTSSTFSTDTPSAGWARIQTSGGTEREIVYYTSRTTSSLTVPAAGRALLGTSAAAGANDDLIDFIPGIRIAGEQPGAGNTIQTIADAETAPTGVTWKTGVTAAGGVSIPVLSPDQGFAIWAYMQIPVGIVPASSRVNNQLELAFASTS